MNDVHYDEGLLTGHVLADIPMEESAGTPVATTIHLRLKGDRLSGFVSNEITNQRGSFVQAGYVRLMRP